MKIDTIRIYHLVRKTVEDDRLQTRGDEEAAFQRFEEKPVNNAQQALCVMCHVSSGTPSLRHAPHFMRDTARLVCRGRHCGRAWEGADARARAGT